MKTYKIDNAEFKLKNSFKLKDLNTIGTMFSESDATTILANLSNNKLADFLQIVLEPVNNNTQEIDFSETDENVAAEIVKDFFLQRIELSKNIFSS